MNSTVQLAGLYFILTIPTEDPQRAGLWKGTIEAKVEGVDLWILRLISWQDGTDKVLKVVGAGDLARCELYEDEHNWATECTRMTVKIEPVDTPEEVPLIATV